MFLGCRNRTQDLLAEKRQYHPLLDGATEPASLWHLFLMFPTLTIHIRVSRLRTTCWQTRGILPVFTAVNLLVCVMEALTCRRGGHIRAWGTWGQRPLRRTGWWELQQRQKSRVSQLDKAPLQPSVSACACVPRPHYHHQQLTVTTMWWISWFHVHQLRSTAPLGARGELVAQSMRLLVISHLSRVSAATASPLSRGVLTEVRCS